MMSTCVTEPTTLQLLNLLIECFAQPHSKHERITTSKFILETNDTDQIVYSFGLKYWYKNKWRNEFGNICENIIVESRYDKFKDEILDSDGKILLSVNRWNKEMEDAIKNQKKEQIKENCTTTTDALAFYIKCDTLITVEHLIALQLYCNTTTEQILLSESYRFVRYNEGNNKVMNDTIQNVATQHSFYANWGRLLYETVNVFGNRQWDHECFYHGIEKEMLFSKTTFIYIHAPLNTTSDLNLAINKLSDKRGMVINIDGTMNNCFEVKWVNNLKESEFLFVGSMNPFRINDVCIHRKSWISLKNYLNAINEIIEEDCMQQRMLKCDQECLIKMKLLKIKDEISKLSSVELQNSLDEFAYKIIEDIDRDNKAELSAVQWIVKLFYCYLTSGSNANACRND